MKNALLLIPVFLLLMYSCSKEEPIPEIDIESAIQRGEMNNPSYRVSAPQQQPQPLFYWIPLPPPILDQGLSNACGSHALAVAMSKFIQLRDFPNFRRNEDWTDGNQRSPWYIWRLVNPNNDPGVPWNQVNFEQMLTLVRDAGCCSILAKPNNNAQNTAAQNTLANVRRFNSWVYINGDPNKRRGNDFNFFTDASIQEIKAALLRNKMVVMKFYTQADAQTTVSAATDWTWTPADNDYLPINQHYVVCDGYNDQTGRLSFRNSGGVRWGTGGKFRVPYSVVKKRFIDAAYIEN